MKQIYTKSEPLARQSPMLCSGWKQLSKAKVCPSYRSFFLFGYPLLPVRVDNTDLNGSMKGFNIRRAYTKATLRQREWHWFQPLSPPHCISAQVPDMWLDCKHGSVTYLDGNKIIWAVRGTRRKNFCWVNCQAREGLSTILLPKACLLWIVPSWS